MGLDTVELVMAIEDEFGIAIRDEDAARLGTPGAVADYVLGRVRTSPAEPCPPQVGFYQIRLAVMREFSIPRREIRPSTPLEHIVKGEVRANWARLWNSVGAERFPPLARSMELNVLACGGVPLALGAGMIAFEVPMAFAIPAFVLVAGLVFKWTARFGTRIPKKANTIEAMIPHVSSLSAVVWTRETILARVIQITSEQLGLPITKIGEDSHFVYDLGAD